MLFLCRALSDFLSIIIASAHILTIDCMVKQKVIFKLILDAKVQSASGILILTEQACG